MTTVPKIEILSYSDFMFKIFSCVFHELVWFRCEQINKRPPSKNAFLKFENSILNAVIGTFLTMPKTAQNDRIFSNLLWMRTMIRGWSRGHAPLFYDHLITELMEFKFDITMINVDDFSKNCFMIMNKTRSTNPCRLADILTNSLVIMQKLYFPEALFASPYICNFIRINHTNFCLNPLNRLGKRIKHHFESMFPGLTIRCEPPLIVHKKEDQMLPSGSLSMIPDECPPPDDETKPVHVTMVSADDITVIPPPLPPTPVPDVELKPVYVSTVSIDDIAVTPPPIDAPATVPTIEVSSQDDTHDSQGDTLNFELKRGRLCLGDDDEIVFQIQKFRRMIITKKENGEFSVQCLK